MKQNVATNRCNKVHNIIFGGNFCGACRGLDQGDKF